jgi:excinuclease UvrABC nuclease subunit
MEQEMQQAAASMNFENAARLRDAIGVLRRGSTPVPTSQAAAWPQRLSQ